MRTDEQGQPCPSTLGEYRKLCAVLSPHSKAVALLDEKIVEQGEDAEVEVSDSQMRALLYPLLLEVAEEE